MESSKTVNIYQAFASALGKYVCFLYLYRYGNYLSRLRDKASTVVGEKK